MLTQGILIALLLAHLKAYSEQYIEIASCFVVTFALKKLIKTLDSDVGSMFGIGGYALTITCIISLLSTIKSNGTANCIPEEGSNKIIGGVVGNTIDKVIDKFIKH